jgi:hypothetical protein
MTASGYYPGSSRKVRQYDTDYTGDLEKDTEPLQLGKARTYLVEGKPKQLYPMGALARALNRAQVTVRKLEQEGIIPQATLKLPSHDERGTRRLYTYEQIMGLRQAAEEEGVLCPNPNGKWKAIEGTQFREKALKVFRENK